MSASSDPYGFVGTSRNGRAPRAASVRTNASTFARYCAFTGNQGVVVEAPKSSLSAIHGNAQPEDATAR